MKTKEAKKEFVPHNCGECSNFHFDWNKHWCGIPNENAFEPRVTLPSTKYVEDMRKCCKHYRHGRAHNHEW